MAGNIDKFTLFIIDNIIAEVDKPGNRFQGIDIMPERFVICLTDAFDGRDRFKEITNQAHDFDYLAE